MHKNSIEIQGNNANAMLADAVFRPMLFSTLMVQAILEGRKTQTRRMTKYGKAYDIFPNGKQEVEAIKSKENILPNNTKVGDIIWVRETWQKSLCPNEFVYKADTDNPIYLDKNWKWKPSLFMPKEVCRLFLKVTNVQVQRLQDISEEDAIAEGVEVDSTRDNMLNKELRLSRNYLTNEMKWMSARLSYKTLWEKINGKESWAVNPFVWVYSFKVVECPHGFR